MGRSAGDRWGRARGFKSSMGEGAMIVPAVKRLLYVSAVDVTARNGMLERQQQILQTLTGLYPGGVDILSLHASPKRVRQWLAEAKLRAGVLEGLYAKLARLNQRLWYVLNVLLCNKLRFMSNFRFPIVTPLPRRIASRYDAIVCYYAWPVLLLDLESTRWRVVVDVGDAMADRHRRIGARTWVSLSKRHEKAVLTSARCVAISEGDRELFQQEYGVDAPVVPFVPPNYDGLLFLAAEPRPRRAGFFAARGYHSREILRLLAQDEFLSLLRDAEVDLVIGGQVSQLVDLGLRAKFKGYRCLITGTVAAPSDFYALIGVALNPVGPSTGMKIKSVEALLAGRILVTTPFGVDKILCDFFGDQIVILDWPVAPAALGLATLHAIARLTQIDSSEVLRRARLYIASGRRAAEAHFAV